MALAVVVGANAYGKHRTEAAAEALFEADQLPAGSDELQKKLDALVERYSRTFAGKDALMQLGSMMVERKDYEAAIENFKTLAEISRNKPLLRIAALHRQGSAQIAAGKPADAAQTFRMAAADPHNLISLTSNLMAAWALERAKDYAAAAELYRMIINDAGEGDLAVRDASEERLLWLFANGRIDG